MKPIKLQLYFLLFALLALGANIGYCISVRGSSAHAEESETALSRTRNQIIFSPAMEPVYVSSSKSNTANSSSLNSSPELTGVITCEAYWEKASGGYNYNGCKNNNGEKISFLKYVKKNIDSENVKILNVILDNNEYVFYIYYLATNG